MLLLVALHGCTLEAEPVSDAPPRPVSPPNVTLASAGIATSPDRAPAERAPVAKAPFPSAAMGTTDCYGYAARERYASRGGGAPAPSPAPAMRPAPKAAPPVAKRPMNTAPRGEAEAPVADAAPPPPAEPAVVGGVAEQGAAGGQLDGRAPSGGEGGNKGAADEANRQQAPEKPATTSTPVANQPVAADPARGPTPPDETAARRKNSDKKAKEELRTRPDDDGDGATAEPTAEEAKAPPKRIYDWGATVFLSNDDSMSLASAQRVLWALKRGAQLQPHEIRPHELLNYFSFDSVPPAPDRTFGVLGSAEQTGDVLTVALAVRGANAERQPLDLTLLVDRSCSMTAEGRMDYTKRGLELLANNLQTGDRVDLVLFDSDVCTPVHDFVVGRDDNAVLLQAIRSMQPRSGTDLNSGLQAAYALQTGRDPADTHHRNKRVLLVTDALMNEGQASEAIVAQVGTNLEQRDIRLSGVGVGREFNDRVLDKLTENGKGAYVYLGSEAVVDRVFGPGLDALVRTVAHDVHFSIDLPPSLAMERFYGEEASTVKADVKPIHYFAGTTQLFLQDLKIADSGLVRDDPITMHIEYRDAITDEPREQALETTVGALLDGDAHNLHKGQALMAFADWVVADAMRGDPCGAPLRAYKSRSDGVPGDAELAYVNGLVGERCHVPMETVVARGVQLKLKLDADQPIANVALSCGGRRLVQNLSGSDTIARFEAVEPGDCTVELAGQIPLTAAVSVPETGGDVRCMVRAGRVSCS